MDKLIKLMKENKDNKDFIQCFIELYNNEELYGVMRKIQHTIHHRNMLSLRIYNNE